MTINDTPDGAFLDAMADQERHRRRVMGEVRPNVELVNCRWCWTNRPAAEFCEHTYRLCTVCCPAEHGDPERVAL